MLDLLTISWYVVLLWLSKSSGKILWECELDDQIFKEALDYAVEGSTMSASNSSGSNEEVLDISKTRRLIYLDNNLQLELSVKIQVLRSAWTAKFVFQLEPVSLEHIDILEAKLRDVQDDLEKTKATKKMTHLEAASHNVPELNKEGQIIWDDVETDQFELTNQGVEIRFLVPGMYLVSVMVFLAPKEEGASVDLLKNGDCLESNTVAFVDNRNTSAPIGWSGNFEIGDKLSVIATGSPIEVGAGITIAKIGE